MWVSEQRIRRGPVIGKPADARRAPSSVTLGPWCASNHRSLDSQLDPARISPARSRRPSLLVWIKQPEEIRVEMIPDTESVCQSSEAAVRSGSEAGYHQEKMRSGAEKEAASVTAWKRYQQLVAAVESRGGNFNRKLMLEAIFRGNDLVYASH